MTRYSSIVFPSPRLARAQWGAFLRGCLLQAHARNVWLDVGRVYFSEPVL